MRAIDTNVLIRLLVGDDLPQVESAEVFVSLGAWVSHIVLVESIWVLEFVYAKSKAESATAIAMLLKHEDLIIQEPEVVAAALDLFRSRPSLGFSDCLILEIARKAGHLPLGTFDRKLSKTKGSQLI